LVWQAKNVRIWDANATRQFLDQRGLHDRQVGDLGPVYGFQWRHFGAKYVDMHTNYQGQGVDQLSQVIHQIKTDPYSRRIIMTAWNPPDLDLMALPPCHMMVQFYVCNNELSCHLYQRSADMGLGVPFNIASYALLTRLIAHCCDLEAGEFVHTIGDCHVYTNHIAQLQQQLTRKLFAFPKLTISDTSRQIDQIEFKHLQLCNYKCHAGLKMDLAV
jgi:thymidylate synthase